MAFSHANCDHPRTPSARAACRKARGKAAQGDAKPSTTITGTRITPKRATGNVKRPGTHLRTIGDLPDVPQMLAYGCRIAWDKEWPVVVGHQFNDSEKRIVVTGPVAEVSLVWKPSLPHGVWGVFVRKHKKPITHRIADINTAFRMAAGDEPLPWGDM